MDKELDDIVDSCIIEVIDNEAIEDRYNEVLRSSKNFKNGMCEMKDSLTIMKAINSNKSAILTNRDISMKSETKILEVAEKNNKLITIVNNKFNKIFFALLVIFFLCGVIIGMQNEAWLPYVKELLDFGRTANGFIRLGGN